MRVSIALYKYKGKLTGMSCWRLMEYTYIAIVNWWFIVVMDSSSIGSVAKTKIWKK